MAWKRVTFRTGLDESRPIKLPAPGPWWRDTVVGEESLMIAYTKTLEQVLEYWPTATGIQHRDMPGFSFEDTFPKPKWLRNQG